MTIFITNWLTQTWGMTLEAAPWLLGGFVLAGVIYVLLPVETVTRHLGKPGMGGVLKASLVGVPLPLCSCSVIPVAASLRKQGASRGAFVSFLISTPETGVDSIAISYALLGPLLAVVRPVAAFFTALTAGLLVDTAAEAGPSPKPADAAGERESCCCAGGCPEEPIAGPQRKLVTALRYGLVDLFVDLSPWLLSGFILAGLVAALLPAGFFERYVGSGAGAMLLMLVVGLPFYVCATASTPIAAAFIARGLSPGAALVFLLVGPATNIATMLVVGRDVGRRGLAVYLVTIAVFAVLFGLGINVLADFVPLTLTGMPDGTDHHVPGWAWLPAAALILLTLNGLRLRMGLRYKSFKAPNGGSGT